MDNSVYTIQSGDSLSIIATKCGVSVEDLMSANSIQDANKIQAGTNLVIPMVQESSVAQPIDSFNKTATSSETTEAMKKEPWENLETLIKNGKDKNSTEAKLTAETGWFGIKTGKYNYTADGSITYRQLKEQLDFKDGFLRNKFPNLFKGIQGGYDDAVIPEGTTMQFSEKELPTKPMEIKDKDGNYLDGFSKSLLSDRIVYTVQSGDTQTSIYKTFEDAKDGLKGYRTSDALRGYPEENLQTGTKVFLDKKFLGIF